jgi:hypothetical protein
MIGNCQTAGRFVRVCRKAQFASVDAVVGLGHVQAGGPSLRSKGGVFEFDLALSR